MPNDPDNWRREAVCATTDPELFFARGQHFEAKAICVHCPIKQACLTEALDGEIEYGVWGGLSAPERLTELQRIFGAKYKWPSARVARNRATCSSGMHPMVGDNILTTAVGQRCRACKRDRDAESRDRRPAMRLARELAA